MSGISRSSAALRSSRLTGRRNLAKTVVTLLDLAGKTQRPWADNPRVRGREKGRDHGRDSELPRFRNFENVIMRALLSSVPSGFFFYQKSDFPFLRLGWRHELADGVEHYLELRVVFILQVGQLPRQLRIRRQHLPQPNKAAHDFNIDPHCPLASKHAGKHGNTLFSKCKWEIFSMPAATDFQGHKM